MRLFKRNTNDTSPQLVSATPIPQDGTDSTVNNESGNNVGAASSADAENNVSMRTAVKEVISDVVQKAMAPQSAFPTRKEISTWGRKVGKRWDQLTRSDSSELLSVSGRRRRWSPNRKSANDAEEKENGLTKSLSPVVPKPKRISRNFSLRNFFRSERNNNFSNGDGSSKNVTIQEEEDVTCIAHYPMEKALSEGAIKSTLNRANADRASREALNEKKRQLSQSIQGLEQQERMLSYLLTNQDILKTREGTAFARATLNKVGTNASSLRRISSSTTDVNKNNVTAESKDSQLESVKRNLFTGSTNRKDLERMERTKSYPMTNLNEMMHYLKLGCDESGYDSDSTRTGADSPDSEKLAAASMKPRSLSLTSEDFSELSAVRVTDNSNISDAVEADDTLVAPENMDDTISVSRNSLNDSMKPKSTVVGTDGSDTESCDDGRFTDDHNQDYRLYGAANEDSFRNSSSQPDLTKSTSDLRSAERLLLRSDCNKNVLRTPQKKHNANSTMLLVHPSMRKSQNIRHDTIILNAMKHKKKASSVNLLDDAASPCKDSPPASKINNSLMTDPIEYFSPKRSRSNMESGALDNSITNKLKKQATMPRTTSASSSITSSTPSKTLVRRELKTMKLFIDRPGTLGISVERRDAARPYYVISKMDPEGEAAKSKQLRVGDEIVRVCGRRLRGMSVSEARTALRSSFGAVDLQIAREPTFSFGEEIGDTWGDNLVRTRSDTDVWKIKDEAIEHSGVSYATPSNCEGEVDVPTCQVINVLRKTNIANSESSISNMEAEEQNTRTDSEQRVTGMRKFHVVRKRSVKPVVSPRRATSLSLDLVTVMFEKGSDKKLGFTIVGGSDSVKGSMGIFVKDIKEGGQAADGGLLRVGDEILAINGVPMNGMTHEKAVQTFRTAKTGKMILHIGRRDPIHKRLWLKQS